MTAIKEPNEGYDELEAIPHSFAVEFSDDSPWCMYADSEEEKVRMEFLVPSLSANSCPQDIFTSLLAQAAGL